MWAWTSFIRTDTRRLIEGSTDYFISFCFILTQWYQAEGNKVSKSKSVVPKSPDLGGCIGEVELRTEIYC